MATIDISEGRLNVFSVKDVGYHSERELKVNLMHAESHAFVFIYVPVGDAPEYFLGREFLVSVMPRPIEPPPVIDDRQLVIPGTEEELV